MDLVSIENRTFLNKEHIKATLIKANMYTNDPERKERLEASECLICWRGGRVGGSMMTERQCGLCDAVMHFGNTCVDVLCNVCAKREKLCKHCGGDVDLKKRRRKKLHKTPDRKDD